jgi:hypothetical protein
MILFVCTKMFYMKCIFYRHEREGTLQVDEEIPITASSREGASQLDTNGIMLIG